MTDTLELAVNHAVSEYRMAMSRMQLLRPGMGLDAKRGSAWCEYGFPNDLGFQEFYDLYRRGGLAHGAVNKLIGNCWKTLPWIIQGDDQDNAENETTWERKTKAVITPRMWRRVKEADRRRLVGRYAGLLIRVRDGGKWEDPIARSAALVDLIPAWQGALMPIEFDQNEDSEAYGEPTMWQYQESGVGNRPGRRIKVHPDRVFILGDWTADGIGFLEPAYNAFVSLEKVEGGSGESFLKNAARHLSVSFDKEVDLGNIAQMYGVSLQELHTKFNEAARDINRGNDVMLINQGAKVDPLVSNIPDPRPTYDVNLQTVSAALDIPSKILVGMQTGERASTEDQEYFNSRCQSRRADLAFEFEGLIDHLMRVRVIDTMAEYTVMWDDLSERKPSDKLAAAKIMSEINVAAIATGQPVFEPDEIREAAGYDPIEFDDPLTDEDDDGTPTDPADESE